MLCCESTTVLKRNGYFLHAQPLSFFQLKAISVENLGAATRTQTTIQKSQTYKKPQLEQAINWVVTYLLIVLNPRSGRVYQQSLRLCMATGSKQFRRAKGMLVTNGSSSMTQHWEHKKSTTKSRMKPSIVKKLSIK